MVLTSSKAKAVFQQLPRHGDLGEPGEGVDAWPLGGHVDDVVLAVGIDVCFGPVELDGGPDQPREPEDEEDEASEDDDVGQQQAALDEEEHEEDEQQAQAGGGHHQTIVYAMDKKKKKKKKKTKRRANHGVETESWVWTKRNQLKMPREGERVKIVEMFAGDGDAVGMDGKAAAVRLSRRSLLLPSARPDRQGERERRVGRDDAALFQSAAATWWFAGCLLFAGLYCVVSTQRDEGDEEDEKDEEDDETASGFCQRRPRRSRSCIDG
ncbi:uncharacterized protein ARB_02916 [Trichophyton benhamiae CBS 112371]|uniref:Uncharacterized protein n=1 Tax=Arthroderma benhamiae (strain ATCC MYA-4681 / CBS 112371) TaxID=663331 RepID=D4B382_ARTBC|nr:uncharacterized protein ARB_02916 [Trichophyton benhamiae CBS 112371]EFE30237.1 hypothetical protein ARB_02916 [Trichophyton benhamiae CBS 112371]